VSVRPEGQREFGIKTELKNINSFRFVERALEYEIKRQIGLLREGGKVVQETRLWDSAAAITQSMRSKEEAHDYRYFPEPDLVPIAAGEQWVEEIGSSLPELPDAKRKRFITDYGLPEHDADLLTSERAVADWFEAAVAAGGQAKAVSNWMMGDLMRYLNEEGRSISECPLKPSQLAVMLRLIDDSTISGKLAKTVFDEMCRTGKDADVIVKEQGLVQISDKDAIESVVDETLARNPKEVGRYRAGEEKLLGFFVGQVMKQTKGKANPQILNDLLKRKLSG
jgi:aspartyl-tRNA(Asn)/glutamyl-tRNA(Gln) amidotransferase subunit B